MARLRTYEKDQTINDDDKLVGTDSQTGATKSYKVGDLSDFIKKKRLFTHNQSLASNTWVVNHNLGMFPNVCIKFSSSDEIYENVGAFCGVKYNNNNTLTITLAAAESGTVYLN